MASIKILRLQKELKKLFNTTVVYKLRDQRLSSVFFSDVVISTDLRIAKVYFHHSTSDCSQKELVKQLTKASGQFKKAIGEIKIMRIIPDLKFFYDDTQENAEKINTLLKRIAKDEDE